MNRHRTLFILLVLVALLPQSSIAQEVVSFTLINAETSRDIATYPVVNGTSQATFSITETPNLSVRANTIETSSVTFSGLVSGARTENIEPFSLLGDSEGTYTPWQPSVGVYNISASPSSFGSSGETAILRLTLTGPSPEDSEPRPDSESSNGLKSIAAINYLLLEDNEAQDSENLEDVCAAWDGFFPENAVTVTEQDKASLQSLLDQHKVLRLEPGDYRTGGPSQINIASDQSIVALSKVRFPNIQMSAGTTGVRLEGLRELTMTFEAGDSIRYNCFKNFRFAYVNVENAVVERNSFIDFSASKLKVDTSQNGHFSDNRFLKLNSHGHDLPIEIKGDSNRLSGGNAFLLTNSQTPPYSAFSISDQQDIAFVGVDLESYNTALATEAFAFQVRNTGTFRAINANGMNRTENDSEIDPAANSPAYDLDAESVFLQLFGAPTQAPILRLGPSNEMLLSWNNGLSSTTVDDDATDANALRFFAQEQAAGHTLSDVSFKLEDTRLTSQPAASIATPLRNFLTQPGAGAAWGIPDFGSIPNPTGANWDLALDQKNDESAAIQALVNSQGVAYLEPRTYYIGSPIKLGANQGIVGAGADKTAIVALNSNFDMIEIDWIVPDECSETTAGFTLAELTLQGGRNGIRSNTPGTQINSALISHVTFRNMANAGILLDGNYGWDNNFFSYLNFVENKYGVKQEGQSDREDGGSCYAYGHLGETAYQSYLDKTIFYRNQFVRNDYAIDLRPTRANNLNGIFENNIQGSATSAISLGSGNANFMIASSRFANNAGNPSLVAEGDSTPTIVNSYFSAGQAESLLSANFNVEGSTFVAGGSSNVALFSHETPGWLLSPRFFNVYNSVINIPLGPIESSIPIAGMYLNNSVSSTVFPSLLNVLEYATNGTQSITDDTRNIFPLLYGTSNAGSHLLRGADWNSP